MSVLPQCLHFDILMAAAESINCIPNTQTGPIRTVIEIVTGKKPYTTPYVEVNVKNNFHNRVKVKTHKFICSVKTCSKINEAQRNHLDVLNRKTVNGMKN
jgi:hypothetical protein